MGLELANPAIRSGRAAPGLCTRQTLYIVSVFQDAGYLVTFCVVGKRVFCFLVAKPQDTIVRPSHFRNIVVNRKSVSADLKRNKIGRCSQGARREGGWSRKG